MFNSIVERCKSVIVEDSFAAGANINEFVQGFVDGKLEQKLRSEETPEAQVCVAVAAATSMLIPCSYCVTSARPYCVTSARPVVIAAIGRHNTYLDAHTTLTIQPAAHFLAIT